MRKYKVDFLYRPGLNYSDEKLQELISELQEVASCCFDELPNYQCISGSREELSDKVITIARNDKGKLIGFCSAVLLPIPGMGSIFHLGLTCVLPQARGFGLTHVLTSKVLVKYLLFYRPIGCQWISNVACVLSSLGNCSIYFRDIYPSPFFTTPSETHKKIAETINNQYRKKIHIDAEANFDDKNFVFRGSVKNTVFQKEADDLRFFHRQKYVNNYYKSIINFEEGDEVLQIGHISLFEGAKYFLKRALSINTIERQIQDAMALANLSDAKGKF
ncbi:hypothetical protein [Candidatus Uabimicrobium sp. HlEnr_7]|uniref:hypothetical protein n=1 Tax=Candidatus Uabimicrobium helgolandensis TaxID=3095367 RepID=UPI0035585179